MQEIPAVPLTLEGSAVLHQIFHFDWTAWKALGAAEKQEIEAEALHLFARWEQGSADAKRPNQSALFSLIGHKGDLLFIHFRDTCSDLNKLELELAQTRLFTYLKQSHSYLSIVELGLYESSAKTYSALVEQGWKPGTPEWNTGVETATAPIAAAVASRLYPSIPAAKYLCFYPMDRKRGEQVNWYNEPIADRQKMMHEHGMIGRRYADSVRQIITGSIGFDDWEWGVDLFANDPLVFKKLIYEMRFDRVSAVYASFGQFFLGVRLHASDLADWFRGKIVE